MDGTQARLRCIVKLGGAAITKKDQFETLNDEVLQETARQLAAAGKDGGLVIVHGAGSFGHFQAKQFGVSTGPLHEERVRKGFVDTRLSVTKLNHVVVGLLAQAGLPAVGVAPLAGGWTTTSRELRTGDASSVQQILNAKLVPVLHGDAVLDWDQGCTILSGDVIVRKLAADLQPDYVVFLTNVAGVYTKPPSESGAVLIKEIEVAADESWKILDPPDLGAVQTAAAEHDTTGGMATKIAEAAAIAALGIPVIIAHAGTPHALAALDGHVLNNGASSAWLGTIIRAKPQ